jgi:regulator of protease activity HflC (stomatin/prohibitin superfamily)
MKFGAGILLLIVSAAAWIYSKVSKNETDRGISGFARIGLLVVGLIFVGSSCLETVSANTVGIPTTFGKVGSPLSSGIHLVNPFTNITEFSTRIEELSMLKATDEGDKAKDDSISVIAQGGGAMSVDVTVRFGLLPEKASELFRQAGTMSLVKERFVRPDAREVVRNVFGQYTAEDGYSTKRAEISTKIADELKPRLAARGIVIDSVNIRDVAPDAQQLAAINAILQSRNEAAKAFEDQKKQTTEAETRKQVAVLDKTAAVTKAEAEAAAVTIAAQAQADANDKIARSLTPSLLDLEKTKACATAIANTKAQVVNVCSGDAGNGSSTANSANTSVIVDGRGAAQK